MFQNQLFFAPGMIALDRDGHAAAGTSTNGLTHKVPGYVHYNVFFLSIYKITYRVVAQG